MQRIIGITVCALALLAAPAAAQDRAQGGSTGAGSGSGSGAGTGAGSAGDGQSTRSSSSSQTTTKDGKTTTITTKDGKTTTEVQKDDVGPWFVTTLTNVQIEVSLTDQIGNQPPEKKNVSMIVSSRSWGKVRSSAMVVPPGEVPYAVQLNVDARPMVSKEGPIQLDLTLEYAPIRTGDPKDKRPSGINQSQTVVLQSGKPLIVAQAADPVSDRKVVVEVKATILK